MVQGVKNELNNLVMALVALAIFLAITLLIVGCEDDHLHNIFLPSDSLPPILVCDTACVASPDTVFVEVPGDSAFCYREKVNGNYTFVCEADKRED